MQADAKETHTRQKGGGYCSRVSCSYDSAIYLCNDMEYAVTTDFDTIAQYANYILDYNDSGNDTDCVVSCHAPSRVPKCPPPLDDANAGPVPAA